MKASIQCQSVSRNEFLLAVYLTPVEAAITECLSEIEDLRAHIAKLRGLREKQVQNEPKETYTPGTP